MILYYCTRCKSIAIKSSLRKCFQESIQTESLLINSLIDQILCLWIPGYRITLKRLPAPPWNP